MQGQGAQETMSRPEYQIKELSTFAQLYFRIAMISLSLPILPLLEQECLQLLSCAHSPWHAVLSF